MPCTSPSPSISRRQLLQLGGIGALGLSLPELLHAGRPLATGGLSGPASGPQRHCIFIVQYGGASHIDSLDPKPDAPADVRGPYQPISTRAPGLNVCELPPRLAMRADRFAVVRSMTHGNGGHDGGMQVAMTGHSVPTPWPRRLFGQPLTGTGILHLQRRINTGAGVQPVSGTGV